MNIHYSACVILPSSHVRFVFCPAGFLCAEEEAQSGDFPARLSPLLPALELVVGHHSHSR